MKRSWRLCTSWLGFALVLGGSVATAAPPTPSASGAPVKPAPPVASGSAHPGHDAGPRETADQRAYRLKYMEDTVERERAVTKHHIWTPEMAHASGNHWRRAYRTLRIRELAQDDNDTATMDRADAHLKKVTDHFFVLLAELTANAPEVPAPPALTSPAAGAQLAVGTPVTFKMAPYKDALNYYCWFWQPGGHYWTNWQASGESYGSSPECTVAADDPKWSKFHSGKAEFYGRAMVLAKSGAGKEYKMWSEPVKVEVMVTGGVTPASSGSATPTPRGSASAGGSK
jgi:hypothetical protein